MAETASVDWGKWQSAKSSFDAGNFEGALKELEAHPSNDGQYYANLGIVSLKLGHIGKAVAYLEMAHAINQRSGARNESIEYSLEFARQSLSQSIGENRLDPASTSLERLADFAALGELQGVLGMVAAIFLLIWMRSYLVSRSLKATLLTPAGLSGGIALAASAALFLAVSIGRSHPAAVLLENQPVRSGPGPSFMQLGEAPAGARVRALGPRSESPEKWRQIRFGEGSVGWLPESSILLLP